MSRAYRNYTDKQVVEAVGKVKSIAGLLRELNLEPAGGNYANMKRTLQRISVDCSHWTGQGWNKGQQLKDWEKYTKVAGLKKHLIKVRGRHCEVCKNDKWFDKPIPIEVHHINGDRTNNGLENLLLICPNCHSFTDNYRSRKLSAHLEKDEVELVKVGEPLTGNTERSLEIGTCRDLTAST